MLRELLNLALIPLTLTDMFVLNLIITSVYVLVAFKVANSLFHPEGTIRFILHWIIKIVAYLLLCEVTKLVLLFI